MRLQFLNELTLNTLFMEKKRVYTFGNGKAEGKADMRELLGGKGANLAEMNLIGVPVPPGFTITTEVCTEYYDLGKDKVVLCSHLFHLAYIYLASNIIYLSILSDKTIPKRDF